VDLEAQRRALWAARSVRLYTDPAGAWRLHAYGRPEDGAQAAAVLGVLATEAFEAARREGRRDRPEAYLYDGFMALVAMATEAGAVVSESEATSAPPLLSAEGGAAPPELDANLAPAEAKAATRAKLGRLRPSFLVRADLGALLRGYPVDGEVCEIAGFGPISTDAALDLLATRDPFLKAIVTDGHQVTGVAHLGRRPNAHQRSALDWLYPSCAAEGCSTRAEHLQSDHRADWAQTHVTIFDLLDRLCPLHHGLKTRSGWGLVEGRGKRAFVPPGDPRHPHHGHGRRPSGDGVNTGAGNTGAGPPGGD
jgi:hypothetical protein